MASLEHRLSRTLECPICLELLTDPKQLACSHTFCKNCLKDMLACLWQTETVNSLTCPLCLSITDVKHGDVTNLTTNAPLKSLVENLGYVQPLCELCETGSEAMHFCQECEKNMCNKCVELHNIWPPHYKHNVMSVKDVDNRKVVPKSKVVYCQEHDESDKQKNICTDVCLTCKKFICMRCRMVFHERNGHTVEDADEYNASTKKQAESLKALGKAKVETIKFHLGVIDNQMKRINNHVDEIHEKITEEYLGSVKKLNENKLALVEQVYAHKQPLYHRLETMKLDHERWVAGLESVSVLLENSLKVPVDGDIIAIRDSFNGKLQSLTDREDPDAQLVTDVADRAKELVFTPDKKYPLSIGKVEIRHEIVRCVKLSGRMISLASSVDGRVAVGYSEGGIEFVSKKGQVQQKVLTDVMIRGANFLSDGDYVVLDVSNNITIYSPTCVKSDISFETLSPEVGGIGILAVGRCDLIYVGYCKANKIQEFHSAGGTAIREMICSGFEPTQIVSLGDLMMITNDTSTRIIGRDGVVKHRARKSSVYPYSTVTKDNVILIAWVKHDQGVVSIEKYNNKLKPMKTLLADYKFEKSEVNWYYLQVFSTGGIAFSTSNRLYIWESVM